MELIGNSGTVSFVVKFVSALATTLEAVNIQKVIHFVKTMLELGTHTTNNAMRLFLRSRIRLGF